MKLDGAFFLTIMRPVEYIEAECDNARIEQYDTRCLDTLPESAGEGLLSQSLMKQPIDIPEHQGIALCVLVAECVAGGRLLNSKVGAPPRAYSFLPLTDIA